MTQATQHQTSPEPGANPLFPLTPQAVRALLARVQKDERYSVSS